MQRLTRRGFDLGNAPAATKTACDPIANWQRGLPVKLNGMCKTALQQHQIHIRQTEAFVGQVLDGEGCDTLLAKPPYSERLQAGFSPLGSAFNEGDEQEIEMVMFDATHDEDLIAEDLWMKASWLSFHDDDASLRFRFSFGVDLEEDVANDPHRQQLAGALTDAVFPESAIITDHCELKQTLKETLSAESVSFVERIVYFNAPNGGAYLHHDLERGHAGVVFAQLTGVTCWLALPKKNLVEEIIEFANLDRWPDSVDSSMQQEIRLLAAAPQTLGSELGSFSNDTLIHLINETEPFVQQLIAHGHSRVLNPGDVILLPQADADTCCWHSVFCLGEEIGQALSFAIR